MKAKRILSISLVSVLLIASVLCAVYAACLYSFASYTSRITVSDENMTLSSDSEEIKILWLSDVQTSNIVESVMAYPTVKELVRRASPDLIVLTGDNISNGSSRLVLNTFVSFMDSFGIPWALVFGNHDPNSAVPMTDICSALEQSEHCLFKTGELADRYGNYRYDLSLCGENAYSLIFMDSEKSGFTAEQVEWYEGEIASAAEQNGRLLPSLVFFHIPIWETQAAHEAYAADPSIGSGKQASEVRVQDDGTGFFDAVKRLGSTQGLFYGHDHENNTFINYEGVRFHYATKTGVTVYYRPESVGGNVITVRRDGYSVERMAVERPIETLFNLFK